MPQIYIMAVITLSISLALWGGLIYLLSGRTRRYFWLLILGLPFSAIAGLYIRPQAVIVVGQTFQVQPGLGLAAPVWFLAFKVLVGPLVEEAIKVIPLLFRPAWKLVNNRRSALWVGFVLGVSFGLGEAAYIAYGVAQIPEYASLPWYAFTGYMSERLMACFTHGILTSIFVIGLQRSGWFALIGYLAALSLHLFWNMPTVLYQFQWITMDVLNIIMIVPFIVLAVIFERLRRSVRDSKEPEEGSEFIYFQRTG